LVVVNIHAQLRIEIVLKKTKKVGSSQQQHQNRRF